MSGKQQGNLIVVGTGIKAVLHVCREAEFHMRAADIVLMCVRDTVTQEWIREINPNVESLYRFYEDGKDRKITYQEMCDCILGHVRQGKNVCVAMYGHPSVFVYPTRIAVRQAREEGYDAVMIPGISAEDCLFADLVIDPAESGCQSYDSSFFLNRKPVYSPQASLVLWMVGVMNDPTYQPEHFDYKPGLEELIEYLKEQYPADHKVIIYEAAMVIMASPRIEEVALGDLLGRPLRLASTLYVPPLHT